MSCVDGDESLPMFEKLQLIFIYVFYMQGFKASMLLENIKKPLRFL